MTAFFVQDGPDDERSAAVRTVYACNQEHAFRHLLARGLNVEHASKSFGEGPDARWIIDTPSVGSDWTMFGTAHPEELEMCGGPTCVFCGATIKQEGELAA